MKLRLDLRLTQKLIMTPQLQQAIKLLQLSRLELQQTLSQHLMDNPLLEEVQADVEEGEGAELEEWAQEKKDLKPAEGSGATDEAKPEGPESSDELGWE